MTDATPQDDLIPQASADLKPPSWVRSSADAKQEEKEWGSTLENTKRENDNRWLRSYGLIVVCITWLFALLFAAGLFTWSIHYLTPWCWLSEEQLGKVQAVLFSGGMGAVISSIIRSQLNKTE